MKYTFPLWLNSCTKAQATPLLRFLNNTQWHTHTHKSGRILLHKWSARRRGRYLHNKHNRRTSVPSVRIEPAIPAVKQFQTYALDPHNLRDRPWNTFAPITVTTCLALKAQEGGGGCWSLTLRTFLTSTTAKFPAYDVFPCHTHEHHYKLKYPSLDLAIRANFFESLNKYLPCWGAMVC